MSLLSHVILLGLEGPTVVGASDLRLFYEAIIDQGLMNVRDRTGSDSGLGGESYDLLFRVDLLGLVINAANAMGSS
jgi:hypothetical protein